MSVVEYDHQGNERRVTNSMGISSGGYITPNWQWDHSYPRYYPQPQYVPELGRRTNEEPCGARYEDGPSTCTLAKGHKDAHLAPVRWRAWQ